MKFLNFFKTTLGITILVVAVLAIILIAFNWDAIKTWWSGTPGTGRVSGSSNGTSTCVDVGAGRCSYRGLYVPCEECRKRSIPVI